MPSAPAVEPPGVRLSSAATIFSFSPTGVGGNTMPGRARVDDDSHGVGRLQTTQQQLHGLLDQRQLVGVLHRAADIDQHHEIRVRPLARRQLVSLDADVNQLAALAPGRVADHHRGLERPLARFRRGPGVVEVVDHLLDAHRILLRQHALIELLAHEAVRGGVDIRRERRHRLASITGRLTEFSSNCSNLSRPSTSAGGGNSVGATKMAGASTARSSARSAAASPSCPCGVVAASSRCCAHP